MDSKVHDLTDELKRLVGWGAQPHRLALMPVLLELAEAQGAGFAQQGFIVLDYLKASIGSVESPISFGSREVQPEVSRRCYSLLLGTEGSGLSASNRRGRVIQLLGVYHSIESWRRPAGPEREFLLELARHMTTI